MSVQQDDIRSERQHVPGPPPAAGGARGDPTVDDTTAGDSTVGDTTVWCSCTLTTLPSSAGAICVLRVAGEIDLLTVANLQTALDSVLSQQPAHLIVDLTGVTFCSSRGLTVLMHAGDGHPTRYALAGAHAQFERLATLLWPARELPTRYPTTRTAVYAALIRPTTRGGVARSAYGTRPGLPARLRPVPEPGRFTRDTDEQLAERAQTGDNDAYRALARRHRTGMYRSALRTLSTSEDPDDIAHDITSRLLAGLVMFDQASPR